MLGEVNWRETFYGIADVLLGENGQSQEEEHQKCVLPIQLIYSIVHRNVNAANDVVKSERVFESQCWFFG